MKTFLYFTLKLEIFQCSVYLTSKKKERAMFFCAMIYFYIHDIFLCQKHERTYFAAKERKSINCIFAFFESSRNQREFQILFLPPETPNKWGKKSVLGTRSFYSLPPPSLSGLLAKYLIGKLAFDKDQYNTKLKLFLRS